MRTFNFGTLGVWPKDLAGQREYMNRLRTLLDQNDAYIDTLAPFVVLLQQATEPSQVEWETAYTVQSGNSLPIPPTADLVWWSTSLNRIAGNYRTVEGDTTIYRREHVYPRGASIVIETAETTTARTVNYYIGENLSHYPALSVTLPTVCDLIISGTFGAVLSSGSGFLGVDFLLNGVKVGDQYFVTASDQGIVNIQASQLVHVEVVLEDMPAGNYTIQMIVGVVGSPGSPPSYAVGGISGASANGIIQMIVKGIAKQ